MSTKKKNILILSITGAALILILILSLFVGKIPMNDEFTTGNTAGNLNNGGYFCEADGKVYFANAYDGYSLYSMNTDETEVKKLVENSVSSINKGGDYLYYAMTTKKNGTGLGYVMGTSGIYRSKLNGKKTTCLDRCHIITMQLCGNYLYYEKYDNNTGTSLEKIKIDKSEKKTVADYIVNPSCFVDGTIYYNGTQKDHYLYGLNTANDSTRVIWQGNLWNPIYSDGYVYYMDVGNNYRLCRYSVYGDTVEILTNDRVDLFNVYGNAIFFQTNSETNPALKRMSVDGSNVEIIREGIYENINVTSSYVYFNAFDAPTPVYKTSTYGPVNVVPFDAAMQAAMKSSSQ